MMSLFKGFEKHLPMLQWIDTHAHLDAPDWQSQLIDIRQLRGQARQQGVAICVVPAVLHAQFGSVIQWAEQQHDAFALGLHPLYIQSSQDANLVRMQASLTAYQSHPRCVAVGEIGLDYWMSPSLSSDIKKYQWDCYIAQLRMAKDIGLPVILHGRGSWDGILKGLRQTGCHGGIAHAFNGSLQQATQLLDLGFALGFGGACTFSRAQHLQTLARDLPKEAIVMETDAPDMPPQWLYRDAASRAQGLPQHLNSPAELPRIAEYVANLRETTLAQWSTQTQENALRALPRLKTLMAT